MTTERVTAGHAAPLPPTPSHTIGPFYGHALPFPGGGDLAPAGHPDAVTVHGHVLDGDGRPVPDALLEIWQASPDGHLAGLPGSMRRDASTGAYLGRDGARFTGFGRVGTDADGHWALRTLPPGRTGDADAPYLGVCVFARGLLHHVFTRIYLPDAGDSLTTDPLLASLPAARQRTLLAVPDSAPRTYRFDVRLQGEEETVFLDFR